MTIWLVELESIPTRYGLQWSKWFSLELQKIKIIYKVITAPTLINEIKVGSVLDANGTCYYKAIQLATIAQQFHNGNIKDGDVFLLMEIIADVLARENSTNQKADILDQ